MVDKIGAGVLLISRKAVDEMIQKLPYTLDKVRFKKNPYCSEFPGFLILFDKIKLDDMDLSEDISFYHRWTKMCGGKIYTDISTPIKHVGQYAYESKYSDLDD